MKKRKFAIASCFALLFFAAAVFTPSASAKSESIEQVVPHLIKEAPAGNANEILSWIAITPDFIWITP